MKDLEILSTRNQMEEFKKSFVWKDLMSTLASWDKDLDIEHTGIVDSAIDENATSAKVMLHLGDISGRRKAIRYFLSIPDVIIEDLKQIEDLKEIEDDTERK